MMDIFDRLVCTSTPKTEALNHYKLCSIMGHEFMTEEESRGWLSLHLDFNEKLTEPFTLVMWSVETVKVTIDEHGQVEKEILS